MLLAGDSGQVAGAGVFLALSQHSGLRALLSWISLEDCRDGRAWRLQGGGIPLFNLTKSCHRHAVNRHSRSAGDAIEAR